MQMEAIWAEVSSCGTTCHPKCTERISSYFISFPSFVLFVFHDSRSRVLGWGSGRHATRRAG